MKVKTLKLLMTLLEEEGRGEEYIVFRGQEITGQDLAVLNPVVDCLTYGDWTRVIHNDEDTVH